MTAPAPVPDGTTPPAGRPRLADIEEFAKWIAAMPDPNQAMQDIAAMAKALRAVLAVCNDTGGPDSWTHTYDGRPAVFVDDVLGAVEAHIDTTPQRGHR
jgi:hypothetical protein